MNLMRVTLILGGVALPAAMYMGGCSSASSQTFGTTDGGSSSGSHNGSSSGGTASSSSGSTGSSGGTTSSSGGSSSGSASSSGSTSSSGGTSEAGSSCDSESTNDACQTCCDSAPPTDDTGTNEGYDVFIDALLTCACATNGPCASDATCGTTVCAATPQNPNTACTTCLNDAQVEADGGAGPCQSAIQTACNGSSDCMAFATCVQGCPQ